MYSSLICTNKDIIIIIIKRQQRQQRQIVRFSVNNSKLRNNI